MFSLFSIVFVYTIIVQLSANPILNDENATIVDNLELQSNFSCDRNVFLIGNQSLFDVMISKTITIIYQMFFSC